MPTTISSIKSLGIASSSAWTSGDAVSGLVASRNGVLHVLAGPREWFGRVDPFAAQTLRAWIPDVRERHVFVCGPASLEHAVMTGMRKAGVPAAQIHHERFGV